MKDEGIAVGNEIGFLTATLSSFILSVFADVRRII
jgi:hypothetical protein